MIVGSLRRWCGAMAAGVAAAALLAGCGGSSPEPSPEEGRLFAETSIWNARLSTDVAIDPASDVVVADLARQASAGATINSDAYSVPIVVADEATPTVRVDDTDDDFLDTADSPYAWGDVPIPARARPADGTDRHLVVWQPSSDTMWEFWDFRWMGATPTAAHGARIPDVSTAPGWLPAPYGAAASGLPLAAGVMRQDEMRRGSIPHALALAAPEIRAGLVRAPATRTDGASDTAEAPVMGSRFRLDPAVDVDALGLHPFVAMLAHAAQEHGLVLRDTAGAVVLYAEDPAGGHNALDDLAEGADVGDLMATFPWDRLQLIAAPEYRWP